MFAKIDDRIFSSSLIQDPEQALVFLYLTILSDADGALDMTYESIAARTHLPVEVIISNIAKLMAADPKSRSKKYDGARLIPLDPNRPTGWRVVNKAYYRERGRQKPNRKTYMREYMRGYMRKRRQQDVKPEQSNNDALNNVRQPLDSVKLVKHSLNPPPSSKSLTVKPVLDSVKQSLDNVKPHKISDTDKIKTLSLTGDAPPVRPELSNILIQHTEAKEIFGQLSLEVFGQALRPTQWPNDMEHWLNDALPLNAQDVELVTWFYRLPDSHPIFTVTRRRQSMRALIEFLHSEIQKVKAALRLLDIKKAPAPEPEPEEEFDGWSNGYREAAIAEFGDDVVLPRNFWDLGGDLQARVKARRQKMEVAQNGS